MCPRKFPPLGGCFDLGRKEKQAAALEEQMSAPEFWQDAARARKISEERAALAKELEEWGALRATVAELTALVGESIKTGDSALAEEFGAEIEKLEKRFSELEFAVLFSGKYDMRDCIVAFHAGTGGTEAMDWAEMLLRMILRFAERQGFSARVVDLQRGGEAGIKSATVACAGRYAYGWLKSEAGVHRLVRISPFDAEKMRHTSFALIEVLPDLGELAEIALDPKDLKIDTFLASGHGGQGVQTTYSAVRVTHLPTGIVVSCQNERSQTQNKETALRIMRAKLHARAEAERQREKQKIRGEYTSAEWGNQIRSYVLQPYRLVKDHRSGFESPETDAVLDGVLESFVEAYLRWEQAGRPKIKGSKETVE
ncbi:peptide chain release factor 2 [Patescibacteria group bacterium]|nr:MAG: peptide chain release factor 2 [Patescibacteria group bacterium]